MDTVALQIYTFILPYAGTYLFNIKKVILTQETDLNTDLSIDEAEELMEEYFKKFKVSTAGFDIKVYYPEIPFSRNPFKKTNPVQVPDFTAGMLIESAKAGRWIYN